MKSGNALVNDIGTDQTPSEATGRSQFDVRPELPVEGRSWRDIHADLISRKSLDYDWRAGRVPLYIYYDNDELLSVARDAYSLFFTENSLGARAFPSLRRMENEVVQMCLSLFHAPDNADGSFTSGGTESLFLALKTARDVFIETHPSGGKVNIVIPRTAHPAIDKAAHYLGVDVHRIDVGSELRVNTEALENAIDSRTIMIVGSAPCYPYGVYDCISQLGEVALSKKVWLHVDACLGGFLAPFVRDEGYPIPDFDFSIPGVTSLSADLHKFGFSAKGASVVLYRSSTMKRHQRFEFNNWPRGSYATETLLGSRPGGAVASAWAVSQYLGIVGYRKLARKTMEAKTRLASGIERIAALEVIRPSELNILLYKSADRSVDINAVAELLGNRGWFVGRSREPEAIHLALNTVHYPIIDEYLDDLNSVVMEVRRTGMTGAQDDTTY